MLPFVGLLALIALAPFFFADWWSKHYAKVACGLAALVIAYYLVVLRSLTKLFALRLAPLGIGVFEVRPGVIRTPMTEGVASSYEQRIADGLVPMGRWGYPEDVARAVAALVGGQLGFATGSVMHVDGALSIPRL